MNDKINLKNKEVEIYCYNDIKDIESNILPVGYYKFIILKVSKGIISGKISEINIKFTFNFKQLISMMADCQIYQNNDNRRKLPKLNIKKEEDICMICLGKLNNSQISKIDCKHSFHTSCIKKWFNQNKSTCPICRKKCSTLINKNKFTGNMINPMYDRLLRQNI